MSKNLKIALIMVLAMAVSCGGIVFFALSLTKGLVDAADGFFLAVKEGDLARARGFLAEEFRASTSEEELRAYLAKSALTRFQEASWSSRRVENDRGTLEGSVETEDGGSIPLELALVKERGVWRIYALRKPSAGLTAGDGAAIPGAEEQIALVRGTMRELARARSSGDFTQFRAKAARSWQQQAGVETFRDAFGGSSPDDRLASLDAIAPRLEGAATLKDGRLMIPARYDVGAERLHVQGKYEFEGVSWKLVGLYLGSTPVE